MAKNTVGAVRTVGRIIVDGYYHIDGQVWKVEGPVLNEEDAWYLSRYLQNYSPRFRRKIRIKRTGKQIREQQMRHCLAGICHNVVNREVRLMHSL